MAHHSKNPALQGVQWRFLSKDVASGALVQSESEFDQPMTEEAQRRIAHLEQALASTQDLEAEYQSFLREAGKLAPGGGSVPAPVLSPRASDLVDGVDLLAVDGEAEGGGSDQIPGDPFDAQPLYFPGARSRGTERRGPPSMAGGGGAGAASYSAEDDEVARVTAHAATGESEASVEPERDSPSPVIIWRHAAPVKLATNVPADLLPRSPPPASSSTGRRKGSPQRGGALSPARGGGARFGGEEAAPPRPDRRQLQHDYANSRAWYLPVSSWTTNGEGGRGRDGEGGGGGEGGAKGSKELLPKLYSSRIYKEYLNAQNVQRIPHYLANVASPPPKPPKAGRGSPSPPRRGGESPEGSP